LRINQQKINMAKKTSLLGCKAYLARHPILSKDNECIGYELFYRDSEDNIFPKGLSDEQASTVLFLENLSLYGLYPYVGDSLAFINYSTVSLLEELPGLLNPKQIIIEIVERVELSNELIAHIKDLKDKGYRFALSDFDGKEKWLPILNELSFIKFSATPNLARTIDHFNMLTSCIKSDTKIIVEKVESYETYNQLKLAGVNYFQGYFFAKPEMISHETLTPSKQVLVQLLSLCAQPQLDFLAASEIVGKDIALTTRLLRMVNNVSPNINTPIHSLRQALVYLGELPFKKLISMFVLSELTTEKPTILCEQGIFRAKLCELLIVDIKPDKMFQAYLIGLLSILRAALDTDFKVLILELNLEKEYSDALLGNIGILGDILALVLANETCRLLEIQKYLNKLDIHLDWFSHCTEQAIKFVQELK